MASNNLVLTSVNPIVTEPLIASNKLDFTKRHYGSFINESGLHRVSSVQSQPDYLSCHNVTQLLDQKTWLRELPPKVILHNISGIFNIGINAIMGPSGSGKTCLLNILAGRKIKGVSGNVVFSGRLIPHNFKYIIGYVPQDNVMAGVLTVRENIMFSAQLRLPHKIPHNEKVCKVNKLINELGLEDCCDTKVGSSLKRGISGGERKRTSIAMELIVSPGIIFLDEPTSGLDAATAVTMIQYLYNMSRHDRIIIMAIHQPRYSIFKLFDSVTLLSRGELVYNGPARGVQPYFTNVLGLECSKYNNPADFFLDEIDEKEKHEDDPDSELTDQETYTSKFRDSHQFAELKDKLDPILQTAVLYPVVKCTAYKVNYFWQTYYLSKRAFKILRRDTAPLFGTVTVIVLSLLTGLIFFQLGTDIQSIRDRSGAMFMAVGNIAILGISALGIFIEQRALLVHEHANGYYSIGAYFISMIFLDLIPLRIIPALIYCPAAYFLSGLRSGVHHFFFFVLTLTLVSFTSVAQSFMFSSFFKTFNVAYALYLMVLTVNMLFAGYIVTLDSLQKWISWLQYLNFLRYGFNAFMWNEFDGTVYCNKLSGNATNNITCNTTDVLHQSCCDIIPPNCNLSKTICGGRVLELIDLSEFNVWWNLILMGALGLIYMTISLLGFVKATRRK